MHNVFMISVMFIAAALGFALPAQLSYLTMPILFIMLTITLVGVKTQTLNDKEKRVVPKLILAHYTMSAIMIVLAYFFIENPAYRAGTYLIALVPPAIAIIPLTYVLKGEMKESIFAEIISLMLSLVIVPVGAYLLIGASSNPLEIFKLLLILLVVPLVLSRVLRKVQIMSVKQIKTTVTILFGILIYVNVSLLDKGVMQQLPALIPIIMIFIITTFIISTLLFLFVKNKKDKVDFALFTSEKNVVLAMTIALVAVGPAAIVPSIIRILITPFYVIYLTWMINRNHT